MLSSEEDGMFQPRIKPQCLHSLPACLSLSNLFIEFILAIKVASDTSVWAAGRDPGIRGNKAVKSASAQIQSTKL